MTDERDPLEQELESLRPLGVSPRLRRGITSRLAEEGGARRSRRRWAVIPLAGLAAACVALAALAWPRMHENPRPERVAVQPPPPLRPVESRLPTAQAYQQAWVESPEALDALLARHASLYGGADVGRQPLGSFSFTDASSPDLIGDYSW